MRIYIIHNFYQHRGGEDMVFFQEVDALQKEHTVKTFTPQNHKGWKGVTQFLSYPFGGPLLQQIVADIDAFAPDVVHVHNIHYALGPSLLRKIHHKRYPLVMTLHNFRLICPSATLFDRGALFTDSIQQAFPWTAVRRGVLDRSILKTAITAFTYWWHKKRGTWQQVDRYLVLSAFAKAIFMQSRLGVAADSFSIKPNFAPKPLANAHKDTRPYFLYIGRLSEEKGIMNLVKAFKGLNQRLLICGDGPQKEDLLQAIEGDAHFQYLGFLPAHQLQELMQHAEALIVPSICYEGMPMTILESFALGTAVLCSEIGILAEMVTPLHTGLHFDPFQQSSIQDTVQQWMSLTAEQKQTLSHNCKATYAQQYTLEKNISLVESIYQEVILEHKKKGKS